jgi:hypothetical protein
MPFNVGGTVINDFHVKYKNETGIVRSGLVNYLDAGIVGSYPGSGTTWTDITGNYNGTLTNGPTFNTGAGGYLQFDGANDYVTLGNQSGLGFTNGTFSIETWVYIPSSWTAGSQYPNVVSKGAGAGWDSAGWSLFIFRDWNGPYTWGSGMRNGGSTNINYRTSAPSNTYLHLMVTADGSNVRLYENGVLMTTGTQTISPAASSTPVWIGADSHYQSIWFPGRIGGVRLYTRGLSTAEVIQNYNATRQRFE